MKFLVTGGTGYLGVPLVNKLIQMGYPVRALVRSKSKFLNLLPAPEVELYVGDIRDKQSIEKAIRH